MQAIRNIVNFVARWNNNTNLCLRPFTFWKIVLYVRSDIAYKKTVDDDYQSRYDKDNTQACLYLANIIKMAPINIGTATLKT